MLPLDIYAYPHAFYYSFYSQVTRGVPRPPPLIRKCPLGRLVLTHVTLCTMMNLGVGCRRVLLENKLREKLLRKNFKGKN